MLEAIDYNNSTRQSGKKKTQSISSLSFSWVTNEMSTVLWVMGQVTCNGLDFTNRNQPICRIHSIVSTKL